VPVVQRGPPFTLTLLLLGVLSKFVPEMVTATPAGATDGVNPEMVGAALAATVKGLALVAVPEGLVTLIVPVVAFCGTATTSRVAAADVTVAATPLKRTVSSFGTELNPVP
jgi:hypothetical protein